MVVKVAKLADEQRRKIFADKILPIRGGGKIFQLYSFGPHMHVCMLKLQRRYDRKHVTDHTQQFAP